MKYSGGLTVVGVSLLAAIASEALSWLLIYRTSTYKSLTESISKTSKKVETLKASGSGNSLSTAGSTSSGGSDSSINKSRSKKIDKIKNKMRDANQSLSVIKFQSGALVAISLLLVFTLLNSIFDGQVVAKLPFEPYPFFQRLTHRNLPGTDVTDCAMVFIYTLCSLSIRPNLQKLLGFAPPRSAASASDATAAASQFFGIQPEK